MMCDSGASFLGVLCAHSKNRKSSPKKKKCSVLVVGGNPQVMLQPCLQAK
jgi:hypothetical protein